MLIFYNKKTISVLVKRLGYDELLAICVAKIR